MIFECANDGFFNAAEKLERFISSSDNFIDILSQIGTIPESIAHDSTEEKLFSKASDSVLARAFRLSRTAKNQKDFKVAALSGWRNSNDYAVLCAPYFHYPKKQSQIYAQAVDHNVCLLSWEHLIFLIEQGIAEYEMLNFSSLWGFSEKVSYSIVVANRKKSFISDFDVEMLTCINKPGWEFDNALKDYRKNIVKRGAAEKTYWENERDEIYNLTYEQAITELIKSKKINEKIRQIDLYIRGISRD